MLVGVSFEESELFSIFHDLEACNVGKEMRKTVEKIRCPQFAKKAYWQQRIDTANDLLSLVQTGADTLSADVVVVVVLVVVDVVRVLVVAVVRVADSEVVVRPGVAVILPVIAVVPPVEDGRIEVGGIVVVVVVVVRLVVSITIQRNWWMEWRS